MTVKRGQNGQILLFAKIYINLPLFWKYIGIYHIFLNSSMWNSSLTYNSSSLKKLPSKLPQNFSIELEYLKFGRSLYIFWPVKKSYADVISYILNNHVYLPFMPCVHVSYKFVLLRMPQAASFSFIFIFWVNTKTLVKFVTKLYLLCVIILRKMVIVRNSIWPKPDRCELKSKVPIKFVAKLYLLFKQIWL